MKRLKIEVFGDVQGVFYRHFLADAAKRLKLNGWCRNEPDGSVYIIIESVNKEKLEKFLRACKKGSPLSVVERVETDEEDFWENLQGFEVR
jgi:acylphosphatase